MLLHNIKFFIRFVNRTRAYFFINIFGLAFAIGCSLLLYSYSSFHRNFDSFHNEPEQIVRVTMDVKLGAEELQEATTMPPLAKALEDDFEEVKATVRLFDPNLFDKAILVSRENTTFKENEILYVDSSFFQVFSFRLTEGSYEKCLQKPYSVVITQRTKEKYFGSNNALGEQLILNNETYLVTGISENPPNNSHFTFDILASIYSLKRPRLDIWVNTPFYTYARLRDAKDIPVLQSKLKAFAKRHVTSDLERYFNTTYDNLVKSGGRFDFVLQPLTKIHLSSHLGTELMPTESVQRIKILEGVAIFILLIACINFINLTTALGSQRAKEIGVKKVFGSERKQLIIQFLCESILYAILAAVIGLSLAFTFEPSFQNILEQNFELRELFTINHVIAIISFPIFLGIVSGIYPAVVMSNYRPAKILKGASIEGFKNKKMRDSLVVVQFSISIFLIVCSLMFYKQMDFMTKSDLGFMKESMLILKNVSKLNQTLEVAKTEISKIPAVQAVSASREIPTSEYQVLIGQPEGSEQTQTFAYYMADEDFLKTYGLQIAEGRNFSPGTSSDSSGAVIVNESLVRELQLENPIGRNIDSRRKTPIIGVIKDFHFEKLNTRIQPLAIFYQKDPQFLDFLTVRFNSSNLPELITTLENTWKKVSGNIPFEYEFLDDRLTYQYRQERSFYQTTMIFTIVSIVISGLGLIGLITFAIKKKEKEISIRKVLGSSVAEIQLLFAQDLMKLIAVASLISIPLSAWFINDWLKGFDYRVSIDPIVFVLAVSLMSIITALSVLHFTLKAAFVNPIRALKNE